jgi:hypothetical protein
MMCLLLKFNLKLFLILLALVALLLERTILIERPQLVGEVSVNFCGRRVSYGQRGGSLRP